jgi:CRISPR system Cascade subunit CasE
MYLARGFLNPVSRDVTRDLANPVALHKTLLRAFPDELGPGPRAQMGLLFRVDLGRDGGAILVLQSSVRPDLDKLPIGYFLDPSDDRLFSLGWSTNPLVETLDHSSAREGQRFAFRLRANTTKKILTKSLPDGTKQNGKRVPVRGDEERSKWLARRGTRDGFRVESVRISEVHAHATRTRSAPRSGAPSAPEVGHGTEHRLSFAGALFDGVLEVTDVLHFRKALDSGIGPAKAYGFGLLSIARAP